MILLGLFAVAASAQDETEQPAAGGKPLAIGDKPPAIDLEALLQAPDGANASWDALRGKVVVLEFWATWCGPCVGAIAHMNELTDAFKDKPVQFISITDEDATIVTGFLNKKPIHGWVGLNPSRSMLKAFGVRGIPHTVIVGTDGKIAAITHPEALVTEHLENVLAGKESGIVSPIRPMLAFRPGDVPGEGHEEPPVFQILIRPSKAEGRRRFAGTSGGGRLGLMQGFSEEGSTVAELLPDTYGVPPTHLIVAAPLPEGKFDLFVKGPVKSRKQLPALRLQAVEATFGLTSQREIRELNSHILTVHHAGANGLQSTIGTGQSGGQSPGRFAGTNVDIDRLATVLASLLKHPVANETGLKGGYDIQLNWEAINRQPPDPETLIAAVHEQLGLDLKLEKRKVEVVVIQPSGIASPN